MSTTDSQNLAIAKRMLFELSHDLLCIAGFDGYFKYISPSWESTLGWSIEELCSKPFLEFIHPDDRLATIDVCKRLIDGDIIGGRTIPDFENRYARKQGGWCTLQWRANISKDEELYLAVARDVTKKHEMEDQLRQQNIELENQRNIISQAEKLSALGQMCGNIAHEINNPLMVIDGNIRQLSNSLNDSPLDRDRLIKIVGTIGATTDRISKIIGSMRNLIRADDHDQMLRINLAEVLETTLLLCSERIKMLGINLKLEMSSQCIECDARPVQISQVLINLLNNAMDAIAGQLGAWITISVRATPDTIHLALTDSGKGIESDVLNNIMTPFFTTKKVGQGTGLGLSISNQIIANHNGKLWYDSESKNTCFRVELPRVYVPQETCKS